MKTLDAACFHDLPNGGQAKANRAKSGKASSLGGGGGGEASAAQTAPAAPAKPDYASMNAYQLRRAAAEAGMKGGARANRASALSYLNSLGA